MRTVSAADQQLHQSVLINQTRELASYIQALTSAQLASIMHVSVSLAETVAKSYSVWNDDKARQSPAIDSFIGDIYSGLRASTLSVADREYAQAHLRILSGLYGILRPFDGVAPYRLEMGYRLPDKRYSNLYTFWGDKVFKTLSNDDTILNLAAIEYSRLINPFADASRIITPRFLTIDAKTREPVFVVVHAKIARGAFARWAIMSRIDSAGRLHEFNDIGYHFDRTLSTLNEPVFVCNEFGGKGLSMRLEKK